MTTIDLESIGLNKSQRLLAMHWCFKKFGSTANGRWNLRNLRYVDFKFSKDATFFILKWS